MSPCLHCGIRETLPKKQLCEVCVGYPRCKGCEVIFGEGLSKPSKSDPQRCSSCVGYEQLIEFLCANPLCDKTLTLFYSPKSLVLRYTVRGNFCGHCNSVATIKSRGHHVKKERGEFTGYLKMMAEALKLGRISEDTFLDAKELNPHDIRRNDNKIEN